MASWFKKVGRKTAAIHKKANRIISPVVSAAATYFAGPVGGAVVGAIGSTGSYYFAATEARNKGLKGKAARDAGRGERKRVAIYSAAGMGVGAAASGITTAAMGGSFLESLGAAGTGQGGAQLLGVGPNVFGGIPTSDVSGFITTANLGSQTTSKIPGLVTQADLAAQLGGSTGSAVSATEAIGGSVVTNLLKLLGGGPVGPDIVMDGPSSSWPPDMGQGGGGYGGGDTGAAGNNPFGTINSGAGREGDAAPINPAIAALVIGGILLLA